jgi:aconitate decarboxylase
MATVPNAKPNNHYTARIADFVAGLSFEAIPPEVIARMKLLILDAFGCAMFGARLEWSRILCETLARLDSTPACAVWGTGVRLSAPHAALVNGALVQSFELDDVHRQGVLHVGAVALPPLLAIAELRAMTGRDFLRAAVAGFEIGPRVGMCMGPQHLVQGWHSGATVGVFSAAAAAAAALQLAAEKIPHALGIAGTQASGLMAAQFGSMVKRMHAGRAAQSGLYAALLAERGFTGITDVFENPYGGFCTTFSASPDRFDREQLIAGLGQTFETMRISVKLYSCVSTNHTSLDAVRKIRERHPFDAADVEQIVVHCSRATLEHAGWPYRPEGMTAAQLNLPFCIATLLLEGEVFVEQFSPGAIRSPERIALAQKVKVVEDPEITARGAKFRHMVRLTLHLRNGVTFDETVEAPRGSEVNFPPDDIIIEKFTKLCANLPPQRLREIRDMVLNLEGITDAKAIASLLTA